MLDRLTPAERTSFVLHDVFGVPFGSVATIVGRSPAACRQLASRARRSIRLGPSVELAEPPGPADRRSLMVAQRFAAAAAGGDLAALVRELDPDVEGWATQLSSVAWRNRQSARSAREVNLCGTR